MGNNTVPNGGWWEGERSYWTKLFHCQVNQLLVPRCFRVGWVWGWPCYNIRALMWIFQLLFLFLVMYFKQVMLKRKFLPCAFMVSKLTCWCFLHNFMVKQLLRVESNLWIWLPHHLDPEITFTKMWTTKKLCSAQILLLQMKEGRLSSCMFPKAQQFWIGIPNYCTVRVPRNSIKFQVSIFVIKHTSDVHKYSDNLF